VCDSNSLGCQCDQGTCVASLCSSDSECGSSLVCRNGACGPAPAASTVQSCQISPDYIVARQGSTARFYVSMWDGQKNPVVVNSGVVWTGDSLASVSGNANGLSADYTFNNSAASATASIKAAVNGKECTAKIVVLSNATVASGHIRVSVVDELTGRPVNGAKVWAVTASDGTTLRGTVQTTGADGLADINAGAGTNVTVTAAHIDFNYLSIVNYDMGRNRDLAMVLRRNQADKYGGFSGTLTNIPATSNVQLGIAGMSLAGSMTDLSMTQLLGPMESTDIVIADTINVQDVNLPAGVFLKLKDNLIKTDIQGQGLAGICTTATAEADILAGTCGTRSAWALAGDVPLREIPISDLTNGVDNLDYGNLLSKLIPVVKRFNSAVVRDVEFTLKTTPGADNGDHDFSNTSHFTQQNLDFQQVPLGFSFVTNVPTLPKYKSAYSDGAIILGGAFARGRGLIPLGLGLGVNRGANANDGKTDTQAGLAGPGLVSMRMAPSHHGLENSDYGVVAIATSLARQNDASVAVPMSVIVQKSSRLYFDPSGDANKVELPGGFMNYPDGARYNFTDGAQGDLASRTFKIAVPGTDPVTGASLYRVIFTNDAVRRWIAVVDPTTAAAGFKMPLPQGGLEDRTFANSTPSTSPRSSLSVQAIRMNTSPWGTGTALAFYDVVENNSTNLDRVLDLSNGFSVIEYGAPSVSFMTPTNSAQSIAKGANVKVKVTGFKVGASADGVVRLSFTGGTSCSGNNPTGATDSTDGKQEILIALPANCVGTNVQITAELMQTNGTTAIDPPVTAKVTADIQ
jgi:hypothetical protein